MTNAFSQDGVCMLSAFIFDERTVRLTSLPEYFQKSDILTGRITSGERYLRVQKLDYSPHELVAPFLKATAQLKKIFETSERLKPNQNGSIKLKLNSPKFGNPSPNLILKDIKQIKNDEISAVIELEDKNGGGFSFYIGSIGIGTSMVMIFCRQPYFKPFSNVTSSRLDDVVFAVLDYREVKDDKSEADSPKRTQGNGVRLQKNNKGNGVRLQKNNK